MRASRLFLNLIFILGISFNMFSQTAENIIDKYLNAIGGIEKVEAIKTLRFTGKVLATGMEINFVQTYKRPMMFISELTMQGLTFKQAFDGKVGWMVNAFSGKGPELMPSDQLRIFTKQADFEGQLFNFKNKGNTVELIGKEELDSLEVYNIKLTNKEGDVSNYFIDAKTFLIVKSRDSISFENKKVVAETITSNYKPVEGFMIPFSMEVRISENPMGSQKFVMEKIEGNIPVEDAYFKMPETK